MISRIEFDQRFQDPNTKSQIATMFMPFLRAPGTVSDLKNNLESLYTTTKGRDRKVTLREVELRLTRASKPGGGQVLSCRNPDIVISQMLLNLAIRVCYGRMYESVRWVPS
ncbi:hypothetical protein AAMO2058_000566200 [Amorphochlora amoebiformis]